MEQGSRSKRLILGPRSAKAIDDTSDYFDHISVQHETIDQITKDERMIDIDSSEEYGSDFEFFVPPDMPVEEYKRRKEFIANMPVEVYKGHEDLLAQINSFCKLHAKPRDQALKKEENTKKYRQLLQATEGFYAGFWPLSKIVPSCGIYPCSLEWDEAINAAKYALLELQLEFVQLVRANAMLCNNILFYLTIEASDTKFYEAKVNVYQGTQTVDFVRPAVHYPHIDEKLNHLITYDPNECPDDGTWENMFADCFSKDYNTN